MLRDVSQGDPSIQRFHTRDRNDGFMDRPLDDIILQDANEAINRGQKLSLSYKVRNTNRAVCTKVSGEIAYRNGEAGLPDGLLEINLTGSAGQSLCAFLSPGLRVVLTGEANDYVGKSMSGGCIVLKPRAEHKFIAAEAMIAGNTCLYGATGGFFYAQGRVGERFAVRNSGATAVVEGLGDHGCEYMTNGTVVVLGCTGRNFAAGMTGGVAYVLDEDSRFEMPLEPSVSSGGASRDGTRRGCDQATDLQAPRKHRQREGASDSWVIGQATKAGSGKSCLCLLPQQGCQRVRNRSRPARLLPSHRRHRKS